VNILRVEELILENIQIAVRDIAPEECISVGSVHTIILEHLLFKNVCTRWVPQMLTFYQKAQRVSVSAEHLNRFE
jgi:hypothetical protein